jgi:hypothetical protein
MGLERKQQQKFLGQLNKFFICELGEGGKPRRNNEKWPYLY